MTPASQISRYRTAVVAIISVAALYGVYFYVTTDAQRPGKTKLHRRNAVHRHRHRRHSSQSQSPITVTVTKPGPNAPFGVLYINRDLRVITRNLAQFPVPTLEELREVLGPVTEGDWRHIGGASILSILHYSQTAYGTPREIQILDLGLDGLCQALGDRDHDAIRQWEAKLYNYLSPSVPRDVVTEAVDHFLRSEDLSAEQLFNPDGIDIDVAETDGGEEFEDEAGDTSRGIKGLLYYIAEDSAKRKAYEHRGIACEGCGESPIRNVRWRCLNCPDYDLCSTCEMQGIHTKTHVFAKIKTPVPTLSQPGKVHEPWYAGDPRKTPDSLAPGTKKRLMLDYELEDMEIDARYDEFSCMVDARYADDRIKINAAISRRAFDWSLTSERWSPRYTPNALYDRIFAFYDTDNNGLIGFGEFLSGFAYLRGPDRFADLDRAIRGFDFDGDGYINRADVLRLTHAKYVIQKKLVHDLIEGHAVEHTSFIMKTLKSSQPISSVFNEEEIPPGRIRLPTGKQRDRYGDMQPLPGVSSVLDHGVEGSPTNDESQPQPVMMTPVVNASSPLESLRQHMSRFDGMMDSADRRPPSQRPMENYEDTLEAVEEDIVWLQIDEALSDLIDPMFQAKEQEASEVEETVAQRRRWRKEIDAVVEKDKKFMADLPSNAKIDPLMATAQQSLQTSGPEQKPSRANNPAFSGDLVPTDSESLEKREAAIAENPLDELLRRLGYSVINEGDDEPEGGADPPLSSKGDEESLPDSTLPQARPDSDRPTDDRLRYLARLDDAEREIALRGGPGRLSVDEIKSMIEKDDTDTGDLRALMLSWLEHAAF